MERSSVSHGGSCKFSSDLLRDHVVLLCCNSLRPAWIQGQRNQNPPPDGGVTSPTAEAPTCWLGAMFVAIFGKHNPFFVIILVSQMRKWKHGKFK